MKLYHGTTEAVAQIALREGLRPPWDRPSVWEEHPSHPGAVYLTDTYAAYYAVAAIPEDDLDADTPDIRVAVIEIDTDRLDSALLVPDEDALEQIDRYTKGLRVNAATLGTRTARFRKKLDRYIGGSMWRDSLRAMGTCAHLGAIPPSAFTRVAYLNLRQNPWITMGAMDAMPGVAAFRFAGPKHQSIIAHLFGEEVIGADREWLERVGRAGVEVKCL